MLSAYLARGLKAGLVAGLVFGLFVALVATPVIGVAESVAADGHAHEHGHDDAEGALPETIANATSVLGGVLFGLLLGLVYGAAFYFLEPEIPGEGDTQSYLLAAAGFVTVSGAPWLVVPPRVPSVEATLGTDLRIAIYVGMMIAGALACLATGLAYQRLRERGHRHGLAAAGAAVPLLALGLVGGVVLPVEPVAGAVPAALQAGYRGMVVAGQVGLWATLAASHAWFLRRAADDATAPTPSLDSDFALAGD